MNALGNPIGPTGGVQREQTMEEILASIRKIIESNEANSDQQNESSAGIAARVENFEKEVQLEADAFARIEEPVSIHPVEGDAVSVVEPVSTPVSNLQTEIARLVSQSPERRVAAAFDDLNSAFVKAKQVPMEDMAETMLRPMLKDWLDNNLPNLVERLVREEISRIARGDI